MRPTILFEGQTLAAASYFERVMRAASALQRLGITAADTVALMMRNSPTVLELMLALRWLGATWCPINWHFKHDELRFILDDCGAKLFIADSALLHELHGAVPAGMPAIQVTGMPAIQTLASNDTGEGRTQNRRIDFVVR